MKSELRTRPRVAVLIDADNIGPSSAEDIFRIACRLGDPILRRAYGTPQRFMGDGGWQKAQHEYGIVSKPQISNLSGKNAADSAAACPRKSVRCGQLSIRKASRLFWPMPAVNWHRGVRVRVAAV